MRHTTSRLTGFVRAGRASALRPLAALLGMPADLVSCTAAGKMIEAGARYLGEFVEEMKASGFVAQALARHRIEGAAVAAAGTGEAS